jgi:hypothetical protein
MIALFVIAANLEISKPGLDARMSSGHDVAGESLTLRKSVIALPRAAPH